MNPSAIGSDWGLEVVRGKDTGRVYALVSGEVVIGNAPGDHSGIDLASQEGDASIRRMASRHAQLDCSGRGLALRDLESPGGTFVNRQRILPGQARPLLPGDLIQLGGVQLKVVEARKTQPSSSSPFSYEIPGGQVCRSWDDVLTASAQRWEALRAELVSGRLSASLVAIGRPDLAPSPKALGSADERLDAWLGMLPTTRDARPELDVHPSRLVIRVAPGGGSVRRSVQVSNVGHRLLQSTARIEPAGTAWLAVADEFNGRSFATVEGTDLPIDVLIPDKIPQPLKAELVIEGNGGSKRVAITLEARPASADSPDLASATDLAPAVGRTIGEWIARQPPMIRVASWGLAAMAIRLLVGVASGAIGEDGMTASGVDSPGLGRVAIVMAMVIGGLGGALAIRRGGWKEGPTGAFAGGCAGVIAASAVVATCRSVEPAMGSWSTSIVAVCALWAMMGSGLAAASTLVVKGKP